MKIWLDNVIPTPKNEGYNWRCCNVNDVKDIITRFELMRMEPNTFSTSSTKTIDLIDIAMDLGDEVKNGGTSYEFLKWLEKTNRNYPIRIHAKNIHEAVMMFNEHDWSKFIDKIIILETK